MAGRLIISFGSPAFFVADAVGGFKIEKSKIRFIFVYKLFAIFLEKFGDFSVGKIFFGNKVSVAKSIGVIKVFKFAPAIEKRGGFSVVAKLLKKSFPFAGNKSVSQNAMFGRINAVEKRHVARKSPGGKNRLSMRIIT